MSLVLHLKRYALKAMYKGRFELYFKSDLVNFNLDNSVLLLNLESFNHLSLGDKIQPNNCFDYLLPEKKDQIESFRFNGTDDIVVAGFLGITGTPRCLFSKNHKIIHTFCLLVNVGCNITMSLVEDTNSNALLFWPESLKVVRKQHIK